MQLEFGSWNSRQQAAWFGQQAVPRAATSRRTPNGIALNLLRYGLDLVQVHVEVQVQVRVRARLTGGGARHIFRGMDKRMEDQQKSGLEKEVLRALRRVQDPDLHKDIVALDFVKDLKVSGGRVSFTIELTTPACPVKDLMQRQAREEVLKVTGVREVDVRMSARVTSGRHGAGRQEISGVRNIVAIGSGKGGVGKSTVAVNLAVALARDGARVGLLDADVYGPNIPGMMGISGQPQAIHERIQPLENYGVKVMSMGFLTAQDTPVIWRGPMLHNVIQQFLRQVDWGELDYLLVDLPPGTGDVQLSLTQTVPLMGAVVVTTPQDVALQDARKAIMMFRQVRVEVLGIVENMSYFECPQCGTRTHIFHHGGGEETARSYGVPFLGGVPLYLGIREGGDSGNPIVLGQSASPAGKAFAEIAGRVAAQVSIANQNSTAMVIE